MDRWYTRGLIVHQQWSGTLIIKRLESQLTLFQQYFSFIMAPSCIDERLLYYIDRMCPPTKKFSWNALSLYHMLQKSDKYTRSNSISFPIICFFFARLHIHEYKCSSPMNLSLCGCDTCDSYLRNNLIWCEYRTVAAIWWTDPPGEKLVILDNLGWYCDVTNVFIRQRQIQIVTWNNRK